MNNWHQTECNLNFSSFAECLGDNLRQPLQSADGVFVIVVIMLIFVLSRIHAKRRGGTYGRI